MIGFARREGGLAAGEGESSNYGIGRTGHFGSRGSAAPSLHRGRSGGDGRRRRDGGGRARRTDRGGIGSDVAEGKSPRSRRRRRCCARWYRAAPTKFGLVPETTFRLSEDTYLEPDVVIYPRATGIRGPRRAHNVLLVVEIANSSLSYDIGRKAALYASFGVRELWVLDAVRLTTRLFREAAADGYRNVRDFGPADRLVPLIAPEAFALALDELDLA